MIVCRWPQTSNIHSNAYRSLPDNQVVFPQTILITTSWRSSISDSETSTCGQSSHDKIFDKLSMCLALL